VDKVVLFLAAVISSSQCKLCAFATDVSVEPDKFLLFVLCPLAEKPP